MTLAKDEKFSCKYLAVKKLLQFSIKKSFNMLYMCEIIYIL